MPFFIRVSTAFCLFVSAWALVLAGASSANAARQASFDCAKARAPVELLICGDDEMAALDREMADLYKSYRSTLSADGRKDLLQQQRAWLKDRLTQCGIPASGKIGDSKRVEARDCLAELFRQRSDSFRGNSVAASNAAAAGKSVALAEGASSCTPRQGNYDAGLAAYKAEDYAKAMCEWKAEAEKSDSEPYAAKNVAILYDNGKGAERNLALALEWYEKSRTRFEEVNRQLESLNQKTSQDHAAWSQVREELSNMAGNIKSLKRELADLERQRIAQAEEEKRQKIAQTKEEAQTADLKAELNACERTPYRTPGPAELNQIVCGPGDEIVLIYPLKPVDYNFADRRLLTTKLDGSVKVDWAKSCIRFSKEDITRSDLNAALKKKGIRVREYYEAWVGSKPGLALSALLEFRGQINVNIQFADLVYQDGRRSEPACITAISRGYLRKGLPLLNDEIMKKIYGNSLGTKRFLALYPLFLSGAEIAAARNTRETESAQREANKNAWEDSVRAGTAQGYGFLNMEKQSPRGNPWCVNSESYSHDLKEVVNTRFKKLKFDPDLVGGLEKIFSLLRDPDRCAAFFGTAEELRILDEALTREGDRYRFGPGLTPELIASIRADMREREQQAEAAQLKSDKERTANLNRIKAEAGNRLPAPVASDPTRFGIILFKELKGKARWLCFTSAINSQVLIDLLTDGGHFKTGPLVEYGVKGLLQTYITDRDTKKINPECFGYIANGEKLLPVMERLLQHDHPFEATDIYLTLEDITAAQNKMDRRNQELRVRENEKKAAKGHLICGQNLNCDDKDAVATALSRIGLAFNQQGNPFASNCLSAMRRINNYSAQLWDSYAGQYEGLVEADLASCNLGFDLN